MNDQKQKVIVILGPTATGKTGLAVQLARLFGGEIISADSRQVYRGMDIGTGKDLGEYGEIPYHLIDVADPMEEFNLARFQEMAFSAIKEISDRGKLPIIAGGTGLYLQAVVDNYDLSLVEADKNYRQELEKKTLDEILSIIKEKKTELWDELNDSERGNKRHLIRYLEIMNRDDSFSLESRKRPSEYEFLLIGIIRDREGIDERIYKRLLARFENEDMIGEVERLHENGVTWERLGSFGLEYKFISMYLRDELSYERMVSRLFIAIRQFAKRQMTWFRRWERQGAGIKWVSNAKEAEKLIQDFFE